MAKQVGKVGGLAAKLGAAGKKAFEEVKGKPVELPKGGGDCPAGVEGIARLTECKFGVYEKGDNAGEYFFLAMGAVVTPKSINDKDGSQLPIEGLLTKIGPEPICDTPKATTKKTIADHVAFVTNQMKLLGADLDNVPFESWEQVALALKSAAPYFRFRTWKGKPATEGIYKDKEPMTNHTWSGAVDYTPSDDDGVDDNTDDNPPEPEPKELPKQEKKAPVKGKKTETKVEKEAEDVPFGDDLDMTADKADKGDAAACTYLMEEAMKLGYSKDEVEGTADWSEAADMIRAGAKKEPTADTEVDYEALGAAADENDTDAADKLTALGVECKLDPNDYPEKSWAEFSEMLKEAQGGAAAIPEKEKVYKVVVEKGKKAVQCQVVAVFPDKETVNVKNLENGKAYKNIPFSSVSI